MTEPCIGFHSTSFQRHDGRRLFQDLHGSQPGVLLSNFRRTLTHTGPIGLESYKMRTLRPIPDFSISLTPLSPSLLSSPPRHGLRSSRRSQCLLRFGDGLTRLPSCCSYRSSCLHNHCLVHLERLGSVLPWYAHSTPSLPSPRAKLS